MSKSRPVNRIDSGNICGYQAVLKSLKHFFFFFFFWGRPFNPYFALSSNTSIFTLENGQFWPDHNVKVKEKGCAHVGKGCQKKRKKKKPVLSKNKINKSTKMDQQGGCFVCEDSAEQSTPRMLSKRIKIETLDHEAQRRVWQRTQVGGVTHFISSQDFGKQGHLSDKKKSRSQPGRKISEFWMKLTRSVFLGEKATSDVMDPLQCTEFFVWNHFLTHIKCFFTLN